MTFKVGIISDTHLGVFPLDTELSKDSFETFEESLKILVKNGADLIIHSGDFYDRIDPPPWVQDKAIAILRSTITGKRPNIKVLEGKVNFEAEDVNIAVPLFLIHGTHDRPIGRPTAAPPFQHMVAAGYANYVDIDPSNEFAIRQVVLEKDESKISITGIGHRPEGYINESIEKFGIPPSNKAVNICCTHNAIEGIVPTQGEYIDLTLFAGLDFVVVGHAHIPRLSESGNLQSLDHGLARTKLLVPGATVATGLYPQEEGIKYAHLLEISPQNKLASIRSFKLEGARQVFYRTIVADGLTSEEVRKRIEVFLNGLPLGKLKKRPLVRVNVVGKLAPASSKRELELDELSARFRDKIHNWSDMLVPSDLYSEDELKHLDELRSAVESGVTLPAAFSHFCKRLRTLKFPAKHFTPEDLYQLFFDVKAQAARKRVENKLNEVLKIEHN